jgi:hypothetical protein
MSLFQCRKADRLNSPVETLIELVPNLDPLRMNQKIPEKLGWLVDYELDLMRWHQMVTMTRTLETQLKHFGLDDQSLERFQQNQFALGANSLQDFQQQMFNYVSTQCSPIKDKGIFLASSDVIESLFGKYKQFSARCPLKEFGQMVLIICLSTMNLTTTVIQHALETIRFADVEAWLTDVFGQSMLSKRKMLFSVELEDTKTA